MKVNRKIFRYVRSFQWRWENPRELLKTTATFIKQLSWFDFGPLEEEKTLRGLSMEKLNNQVRRPLFSVKMTFRYGETIINLVINMRTVKIPPGCLCLLFLKYIKLFMYRFILWHHILDRDAVEQQLIRGLITHENQFSWRLRMPPNGSLVAPQQQGLNLNKAVIR